MQSTNLNVRAVMPHILEKLIGISRHEYMSILNLTKKLHICKHLITSEKSKNLPNVKNSFKILDSASTRYELKLKEDYYIYLSKPELNKQQDHVILHLLWFL